MSTSFVDETALKTEAHFKHSFTIEVDVETRWRMWIRGESLPERWFRINRFVALRAWEEGVKKWGVDWQDHTDSTREDIVLQLALLGELRYG